MCKEARKYIEVIPTFVSELFDLNETLILQIEVISDKVKMALIESIDKADWMDLKTKEAALAKVGLNSLKINKKYHVCVSCIKMWLVLTD